MLEQGVIRLEDGTVLYADGANKENPDQKKIDDFNKDQIGNEKNIDKQKKNLNRMQAFKDYSMDSTNLIKKKCDRHTTLGIYLEEEFNDAYNELKNKINVEIFVNDIPVSYSSIMEFEIHPNDEISINPVTLGLKMNTETILGRINDILHDRSLKVIKRYDKIISHGFNVMDRKLFYFYYEKLMDKPYLKSEWDKTKGVSKPVLHLFFLISEIVRIIKKEVKDFNFNKLDNILTDSLENLLERFRYKKRFSIVEDSFGIIYADTWWFIRNNIRNEKNRNDMIKELDRLFRGQIKVHVDEGRGQTIVDTTRAAHPIYFDAFKYILQIRAVLFHLKDENGDPLCDYTVAALRDNYGIKFRVFRDGIEYGGLNYKVDLAVIEQKHKDTLYDLVGKQNYQNYIDPIFSEFISKVEVYNSRDWVYKSKSDRRPLILNIFNFEGGTSIFAWMTKYALNSLLFNGKTHSWQGGQRYEVEQFVRDDANGYTEKVDILKENIEKLTIEDFEELKYYISNNELSRFKDYMKQTINDWIYKLGLPHKPTRTTPRSFAPWPTSLIKMKENPLNVLQWIHDFFALPTSGEDKVVGWGRSPYKYFMRDTKLKQSLATERYTLIPFTPEMILPGTPNLHPNHKDMKNPYSLILQDITLSINKIAKEIGEHLALESQYKIESILDNIQEKAINSLINGKSDWEINKEELQKNFYWELEFLSERDKELVAEKLNMNKDDKITYYDIISKYEIEIKSTKIVNNLDLKIEILNQKIQTFVKNKNLYGEKIAYDKLLSEIYKDETEEHKKEREKATKLMIRVLSFTINHHIIGSETLGKLISKKNWYKIKIIWDLDGKYPQGPFDLLTDFSQFYE